ncbi:MAG TPA: ABC transporter substrate-binding protein [Acidimicrobiia bacterium]|nr:ABC transporter substrate-binding protein [Acidimicrobiia bacterium]
MKKTQWLRSVVLIALLALVAAACGGTGGTTTTTAADTTTAAPTTTSGGETTTTGAPPEGGLILGGLLPETGSLAFLGPPEIAGALLAVEDINAAGGVLGADVTWIPGDSGDTSTDIANTTVDSHLAAGVHAIFGAASSSVSFTVIDKIVGAGVIQFSPANTSQLFSTYDDNGLYFRTAPSDFLQGTILADLVAADGLTAGVIYRQEPYGEGLAERFREVYEDLGGTVTNFIAYPPEGVTTFDAEVDQLVAADPDAIVVISFEEGSLILETMHARGIGPVSGKAVWGVDGNIGGLHNEMADPSILAGMRGTTPSVDLSTITDFTARLDAMIDGGLGGIYDYGAETYDAIVITALAAAIAGSLDPVAIAAEINDVTRGGTKCTTFAECIALVDAGEDIDYDGIGGPYEFVDAGEPAAASYRVATLGENGPDAALDVYIQAELSD